MRLVIKWKDGWAHVHGTGPDGVRIRRALGTQDIGVAEEARANLEARLWKVSHYGPEAVMTFDETALAYAQDGGEARYLVKITEQLHGKVLRAITPKMIRDAARRAYPVAKPSTVNRQGIVPARAVMNYGHAQGWCPPIRVSGFPVEQAPKKAVTQTYLDTIRPHLPPEAYALMLFLHYTGRRVGEAVALRPAQIIGRQVFFAKTKNGESAVAVMPKSVADLIAEITPRNGLVFGYADRWSLYPTLRRAAKKAGVEYLATHQVGRHSYATALHGAGWSTKAIADAGGWKSAALVDKTYIHNSATQARAAGIFDKILARSTKDGSPSNGKEKKK